MATNKQARAQQKRRYEQLQAKINARQARRRRRQRLVAIVAIIGVVLTFGVVGLVALQGDEAPVLITDPTPTATTTSATLAPAPSYAENRTWDATIDTNKGPITATLDGVAAPQAVASFVYLAQKGFFDGTTCHRVVNVGIFLLQCGSPDGTGSGGPGVSVRSHRECP